MPDEPPRLFLSYGIPLLPSWHSSHAGCNPNLGSGVNLRNAHVNPDCAPRSRLAAASRSIIVVNHNLVPSDLSRHRDKAAE